jgi:hypothetical protein
MAAGAVHGSRLPSSLILIAVDPPAAAWYDLTPLLMQRDSGVCVVIALTAGATDSAAQDACRRGQVVEVGALGREGLPESCRPPGLAAPRPGMVVAWQSSRRQWRGAPIRQD